MKKRLNKLPTNYSVSLSEQEVVNLSETLSAVRTAGGGTGGVYIGDGQYIGVDNTNNRISFLPDAATKLESVSDKLDKSTYAADSAIFLTAHQSLSGYYNKTETSSKEQLSTEFEKYQTVAGMAEYLTTSNAQTTYLTKSSAEENLAPISVAADVEVLKSNSGNFSQYYKKTETSSKEQLSAEFNKYQTKADMDSYATDQDVVNLQLNLEQLISSKQPKLTFGYNENNAISSINDSALAGQGGKTYTEGNGISIDNDTISISADYIQAITSVSAIKGTVLTGDANIRTTSAESGNNIVWTMELTAQPTVTDTTLSGADGIVAVKDSSVTSQWNVTIAQSYRQEIEAVSSKLTKASADTLYAPNSVTSDVDTLKSSSGNWDKVSAKLDTSAFSSVSGIFLTAHQSLNDYYTKTEVDSTFASATQLNNYLTTAQYANDSATFVTKPDTTQTVLNNNYLIYSTLTDPSATTGWMPLSANYYSKTEADGRYVATADVGAGLYYSGSSPKLGVKLGTDLAFDTTTSAIKVNTNGTADGNFAFVEGDSTYATSTAHAEGYLTTALNNAHAEGNATYASGYGAHAEGFHTSAMGLGVHAEGAYTQFSADGNYDGRGVAVEGYANATTAQTTTHNGILKVIGNGNAGSQGITASDAYILYRDGTVKAKDFIAGGDTLSANYPVPKSVPNTADNNLQVQKMFVCTSDADIVAHAALANGEGCIFFRVG